MDDCRSFGIMLTRKIGSSHHRGNSGGLVEMLLGGQFGAGAILSGLIQGIGSELGFTSLATAITTTGLFFGPSLAPSLPSAGALPKRAMPLTVQAF